MEFEKKINIGHLIVAGTLLVSIALYTADIKTSISEEAHARSSVDLVFSERMENISHILSEIEDRVAANDEHRIADEAKSEWDD